MYLFVIIFVVYNYVHIKKTHGAVNTSYFFKKNHLGYKSKGTMGRNVYIKNANEHLLEL